MQPEKETNNNGRVRRIRISDGVVHRDTVPDHGLAVGIRPSLGQNPVAGLAGVSGAAEDCQKTS